MSYPTITSESARSMLKCLDDDKLDDDVLSEVTVDQSGPDIDRESIRDLSKQLYEVMDWVEGMRGKGGKFERLAAPLVHEKLNLSPVVAGDAGFWRWLTFYNEGQFAEIVDLRYGKSAKGRESYLGLGALKQGFLAYLWLCANAVYDAEDSDPYCLARRGQSDLWTSHLIRVDFGSMRPMARAFIRFLHPDDDHQTLEVSEYRELIKELTRRNASTLLELLDEESAYDFVTRVWAERNEWWVENQGQQ